ncbi:hypothetical protein VIBNIAM115_2040016 [Vibrio nigripulchritudo AM115]|nr:hypothetical protein VIBNIAM115_2040016 [Vibrio nigripulchritudo AM115]
MIFECTKLVQNLFEVLNDDATFISAINLWVCQSTFYGAQIKL